MGSNYRTATDYKIGRSLTGMIRLTDLGIPIPNQVIYQEASVFYTKADMNRVGDGYTSVSWIWDIISVKSISNLLRFLDGKTSNDVYVKTDVRDGTFALPDNSFLVYSAIMWKPVFGGQEGTPVVNSPYAIQTAQVRFVNLQIQVGYL